MEKRLPPDEENKRVNEVAEQFDKDAIESHSRNHGERKDVFKKRIQDVPVGQKVPFTDVTALPYWDHMEKEHSASDGKGVSEDQLANPDVLSEDDSVYNRPLTEQGEAQMQAVRETLKKLPPQEQKILQLSIDGVWSEEEGQRVYTEQAIADEIGISRDNVHVALSRIKTKIKARYEKLMTDEES